MQLVDQRQGAQPAVGGVDVGGEYANPPAERGVGDLALRDLQTSRQAGERRMKPWHWRRIKLAWSRLVAAITHSASSVVSR